MIITTPSDPSEFIQAALPVLDALTVWIVAVDHRDRILKEYQDGFASGEIERNRDAQLILDGVIYREEKAKRLLRSAASKKKFRNLEWGEEV